MTFKTRHNLSNDCLKDLLQLINIHCPLTNKCATSSYLFNKRFRKSTTKFHYFCSYCLVAADIDSPTCVNQACQANLSIKGNRSSFIEVPIAEQLKRLLERKWCYSSEIQIISFVLYRERYSRYLSGSKASG